MKAHQRLIREARAKDDPRAGPASLDGFSVETISAAQAEKIILQYEWLGTLGRSTFFVGLFSPGRKLYGVACFGHGPAGNIRKLIGEPALCLERGTCIHLAPPNAGSFLINRACKLVHRISGVEIFFAYCDPSAGEYGGIYQAAGWRYLGQGLDGHKGRAHRYMVLRPGLDPDDPANWTTTRALRRGAQRLTFAAARALGWIIASREAKHVYACNVGPGRRKWNKGLPQHPYPAPDPQRKRSRRRVPLLRR